MNKIFLSSKQEEGFVLGCSTRLDRLDYCEQIPGIQAGIHFYEPDPSYANRVVQKWREQGVCFCGFIHSHVTDKQELSEADFQFAAALIRAYKIPVMWFGLAVAIGGRITHRFYSVIEENGTVHISPVLFTGSDFREDNHESLHC